MSQTASNGVSIRLFFFGSAQELPKLSQDAEGLQIIELCPRQNQR